MTETLKIVLKYAFEELKLNRVEVDVFRENLASEKVLTKVGMKKEGIMREKYYKNELYIDSIKYSMLCKEWMIL